MNGPWRTISVALRATDSGFTSTMTRASAMTRKFGNDVARMDGQVARSGKSADQSSGRWSTWGATIAKVGLGVAAVALTLGAFAVGEAIKFESAMAGVAKTIDATPAQLKEIENGIVSMANRMPASREEIAGVAEAAGQLGIQRGAILGFTEVMIGLGTATNLSSEEAATGLAQFANIMGTSQTEFDRLGSALVDLGNKGASTESEILDMALRLAGAGKLVGASEDQVLALANAMASMGIEAQLGGGGFSRVMRKVYTAAMEGGEAVAVFAETSGMSAEEFTAAWQDDPIRVMDALIQGLAGVKDSGGNVAAVLDDMGIKGQQEVDVMLRLMGAGDLLTQSLNDGKKAWWDNVALTNEVR